MANIIDWVESRTGAVSATTEFLTEDVPGGASYWYVFGSATLFCMILQIVTGIFLTFYYAPSAVTASMVVAVPQLATMTAWPGASAWAPMAAAKRSQPSCDGSR